MRCIDQLQCTEVSNIGSRGISDVRTAGREDFRAMDVSLRHTQSEYSAAAREWLRDRPARLQSAQRSSPGLLLLETDDPSLHPRFQVDHLRASRLEFPGIAYFDVFVVVVARSEPVQVVACVAQFNVAAPGCATGSSKLNHVVVDVKGVETARLPLCRSSAIRRVPCS